MKRTKITATCIAAALAATISLTSCGGSETQKDGNPAVDGSSVTPSVQDTIKTQPNGADTIKIDTTKTEQNPPAIRRSVN